MRADSTMVAHSRLVYRLRKHAGVALFDVVGFCCGGRDRISHSVVSLYGFCIYSPVSVAALDGAFLLVSHHATASCCCAFCTLLRRVPRLRLSIHASTSTRFQRTIRGPN